MAYTKSEVLVHSFIKTHADLYGISPADSITSYIMEKDILIAPKKSLSLFKYGWNGINRVSVWLPKVFEEKAISLKAALKKIKSFDMEDLYKADTSADLQWKFMPVTINRLIMIEELLKQQLAKYAAPKQSTVDELAAANAKIKELEAKLAAANATIAKANQNITDDGQIVSEYLTVKDGIAFIKTDHPNARNFNELVTKTTCLDIMQQSKKECTLSNSIEVIVEFCQHTAAEFNDIASNLLRAKALGASYVIDENFCSSKYFNFK